MNNIFFFIKNTMNEMGIDHSVSPSMTLVADLGLDSTEIVEVATALLKHYQIKVPIYILRNESLEKICEYIVQETSSSGCR